MGELREAARANLADGTSMVWALDPSLPHPAGTGQMLAEVMKLCLEGDIVSIEPTTYELPDQDPSTD